MDLNRNETLANHDSTETRNTSGLDWIGVAVAEAEAVATIEEEEETKREIPPFLSLSIYLDEISASRLVAYGTWWWRWWW